MRYEVAVLFHGRSAKTKAVVYGRTVTPGTDMVLVLEARDDQDAWAQVEKLVAPSDKRPIQGVSYIRHCRVKDINADGVLHPVKLAVGDRVRLHEPYSGMSLECHSAGSISEVLSDTVYSIALDGYCHRFVDFSASQLAKVGGMVRQAGWGA